MLLLFRFGLYPPSIFSISSLLLVVLFWYSAHERRGCLWVLPSVISSICLISLHWLLSFCHFCSLSYSAFVSCLKVFGPISLQELFVVNFNFCLSFSWRLSLVLGFCLMSLQKFFLCFFSFFSSQFMSYQKILFFVSLFSSQLSFFISIPLEILNLFASLSSI